MRYPFFIATIVLFFSSCADHSKTELAVHKAADEGLNRSSSTIASSTHTLYSSLESQLANYYHSKKIEYWHPKGLQVKAYCENLYQYIDGLKTELKNKAGVHVSNGMELYNEDNIGAVNELFERRGKELFQKLIGFRQNILAVDTSISLAFYHPLLLFASGFDYTKNDFKEFTTTFFKNNPAIAAMVMLSKLENNIRINENNLIGFCHAEASPVIIHDDFPELLITQSSKCVKAGEEIQVSAGIGIYSTVMERKVTIDGKVIALNEEPIATYKLKTSVAPGKHIVPVLIEFTQPDGSKTTMTKNVEYTVINPNQNPK